MEPSILPEPQTEEKEGEDQPSARDTKRDPWGARTGLVRADETLTPPEILAVPSCSNPSSSTPIQISPGASSSSGVKRTYSESAALPTSLWCLVRQRCGTCAR